MVSEAFLFAGCRIVKRVNPFGLADMAQYRGIMRDELAGRWGSAADGSQPRGWSAEIWNMLRGEEDAFELIPAAERALAIARELEVHDPTFDVIGCSIEDSILEHLREPPPGDFAATLLIVPDEAQDLAKVYERLRRRPSEPDWMVLGFDVASFGSWMSVIFQDLHESCRPELRVFRRALNEARLFSTAEAARAFREAHSAIPFEDTWTLFVYRVLAPARGRVWGCSD